MALRGHMLTQPKEIGSIVTTPDRQRFLAAMSRHYTCRQCGAIHSQLLGDDPITHADDSLHIDMMNNKLVNSKLRSRRLKKKIKSDSNSDRSTGQNIEKVRNKKLSLVFATKGVVLLLLSALLFFYQLNYV